MKRLLRLARVTEYLHRFRVPSCPDIVPIMTVNQENATSQLAKASSGDQLLIALPEGRSGGRDSDTFDESVSFAFFALAKINGPTRTPESAQAAYDRLLKLLDACLDQLVLDLTQGDPCEPIMGLELTKADVVPEYSVFGGWSGYYVEIVLE